MVNDYRSKGNVTLKNLFRSRMFLFFLVFFLLIVTISLGREWWQNRSINNEITKLEKDIEVLRKNNNELTNQEKILSDDYYIEREARLRLAKQKTGENVVVLTNSLNIGDNGNTDKNSNTKQDNINQSNWSYWFAYFF